MADAKHRDIYARTPDGGVQLASSTDRWHLFDDHVHLAPSRKGDPKLRRFDAELMPFVDSLDRGALPARSRADHEEVEFHGGRVFLSVRFAV